MRSIHAEHARLTEIQTRLPLAGAVLYYNATNETINIIVSVVLTFSLPHWIGIEVRIVWTHGAVFESIHLQATFYMQQLYKVSQLSTVIYLP